MTERTTIAPRRVRFDWDETPLHWIPGQPFVTHVVNVLHMLLPAGERWFVHVYKQVLPRIRDERLYAEVKGFMGQEATHAVAHQQVLDHMRARGLDPQPYVDNIEWMFERLLGDDTAPPVARRWWLRERVALIAAIEHYTAVLGQWVLHAEGLDRAGADPTMLDLLRWHGAEEVEHRSVAYDVFCHIDGSYARRARTMAAVLPPLGWLWRQGVRFLLEADPTVEGPKPGWRHLGAAARTGLVPAPLDLVRAAPRYLRPGFHPSQEGSIQAARDYIAISPSHRAYRAESGPS